MTGDRSVRDALVLALVGEPVGLPPAAGRDLTGFWEVFDRTAPWPVRSGLWAATVVLGRVLPRVLGHRTNLAGLDPAAADDLVHRAATNPITAPLCEAAKVVACFAYVADDEVESALRGRG